MIVPACAEVVSPGDDFWYLDEANVLSDATEGEIFFANQRLYDACGAEIVVVAIETTNGMSIDDYAYTLFNEWNIGDNTYRGLLLLMAIEDDNYYVMPGTAMNAYFDSATIAEMMERYLEPDFARKDYDKSARLFFEAAYEKTIDDLNLDLSIKDAVSDYEAFIRENDAAGSAAAIESSSGRKENKANIIPVLIIMLLALFIIRKSSRRSAKRTTSGSSFSSAVAGFALGRMTSGNRKSSGSFSFPSANRVNRNARPGGFSAKRTSGSSRTSGFGGASRTGRAASPRISGFGGASRRGGVSKGPGTRGGGAGRFSRR